MYATFHIRNHVRDHWFDPREGLRCMFNVKKRHNFARRFDLQGHARVQIFTCKDVSVCALCRHLISICFMTSVVFPRKYLDSVMFMHKFTP